MENTDLEKIESQISLEQEISEQEKELAALAQEKSLADCENFYLKRKKWLVNEASLGRIEPKAYLEEYARLTEEENIMLRAERKFPIFTPSFVPPTGLHICRAKDLARILNCSETHARILINDFRSKFKRYAPQIVTVEEICDYYNIRATIAQLAACSYHLSEEERAKRKEYRAKYVAKYKANKKAREEQEAKQRTQEFRGDSRESRADEQESDDKSGFPASLF